MLVLISKTAAVLRLIISLAVRRIFWKSDTVGIEGQDDLPSVSFNQNAIKGIAGFYNSSDQHHVVIVGTTDGKVYRITWKATTVGIENQSLIAQFDANSIVGVGGFYSEHDRFEHVIVGTNDGKLYELWARSETAAQRPELKRGASSQSVLAKPGTKLASQLLARARCLLFPQQRRRPGTRFRSAMFL